MPSRNPPRNVDDGDLTAIDLFAGAGGLSHGFEKAGFEVKLAVEKDPNTALTYRHNHPGVCLLNEDIRELDPLKCVESMGIRDRPVTVLVGGPPCQGFSESNRRTRTLDNPRNYYYIEFFRFLEALRPRFFVLENVAGLKTLAGGALLNDILARAESAGYKTDVLNLTATDFGVPQVRRRLFVVGRPSGIAVPCVRPTHGSGLIRFVSVRDAIGDLPRLQAGSSHDLLPYPRRAALTSYQRSMRSDDKVVQGNLVTRNSEKVLMRYACIKPGQNWECIPSELMDNYRDASRCHTGIYYRLRADQPSKVIGNFRKNMLIHPKQDRGLSIREAARLQSFPDRYEFLGSIGLQQQQVADAVPPLLAKAVAMTLASALQSSIGGGTHGKTRSNRRSGTRPDLGSSISRSR